MRITVSKKTITLNGVPAVCTRALVAEGMFRAVCLFDPALERVNPNCVEEYIEEQKRKAEDFSKK